MTYKTHIGAEVLIVKAPGHSLPPVLEGLELPARAIVQRPAVDEHHGGLWWVKIKPPFEGPEVQVHADQLRPGDGSCPECGSQPGTHNIACKLAKRDREAASGREPAANFFTNGMLAALTHHTVGKNGGGLSVDHNEEEDRWNVGAEYGREAPGSPMAGAATYGRGSTLRDALMMAGADAGLWINDGSPEPVERQRRILIMEGEHPAELNLEMIKGSMTLVADSDEVFAFSGDKAVSLKHRDVGDLELDIAVAIQRRQTEPEPSAADAFKRIRELAPHEVSCNCGHGGEFDMNVHDTGCPRWQLAHVLAVIEGDLK